FIPHLPPIGHPAFILGFMFPLRAVDRPKKTPWVTRFLLGANGAAFLWQLVQWNIFRLAPESRWGVVPQCYLAPGNCGLLLPDDLEWLGWPLLTSLFLHGDALHLAFNMLFLAVFGPGLEDRLAQLPLGKLRFTVLYLACGLGASLVHIATHPFSDAAVIGASGAIAGLLGAYFVLLPRSWILTYVPPVWFLPIPAPLFLVLWFLAQLSGAWTAALAVLPVGTLNSEAAQIAWMAHLGGFACGALAGWSVQPWRLKRLRAKRT
ncbi:MAG TPA: rhomboid family intramembrane serine protease, partial [Abditibacteriaceae bacterium]